MPIPSLECRADGQPVAILISCPRNKNAAWRIVASSITPRPAAPPSARLSRLLRGPGPVGCVRRRTVRHACWPRRFGLARPCETHAAVTQDDALLVCRKATMPPRGLRPCGSRAGNLRKRRARTEELKLGESTFSK